MSILGPIPGLDARYVKWLPILGDECETDSNTSDDEMSSIENARVLQKLQARERELTERSTTLRAAT